MTKTSAPATIRVDQFVAAPPAKVHQFTLDIPGYGNQPCKVLEVDPPHRFVCTFTPAWTLTWRLEAEGTGTRVFLEHSGFDLDDKRMAEAFDRVGPGWRDVVLPRLAESVAQA